MSPLPPIGAFHAEAVMPSLLTVLGGLVAAVDALCHADPAALADGTTVAALHRQLDRLEAAVTRASAAFEAAGGHEADGARSAAHWIAGTCRTPVAVARQRVALGRALRHMPATEAAWLAGDVGGTHAALLARARTPVTEAAFARDEASLVGSATTLPYRSFARVVAYWRQHADPDGVERQADRLRDGRRLHLSRSFDGAWFLDGTLDPISGAIVSGELSRIERDLFRSDWADARASAGDGVTPADVARTRTPAQRRADALVEMARRSAAAVPGSRPREPLFTVLVGYETFAGRVCELADGTVVSPGSLVPWLGQGWVERVVFDGPSRVVDVGVRRRIFSGATRRAVEVRDRECFHPLCDTPAERCEVDHVHPWSAGGPTTQANGRVACGYHNRARHLTPPARAP